MKQTLSILAVAAVSLASASAQGTTKMINSGLSKVTYQEDPSAPIVDAPIGTRIGLFWGTSTNSLSLVTAVTIESPGLFDGGTVVAIPGTEEGQRVFLKIAGWDGAAGDDWWESSHYGETAIVQIILGPTAGPGTVNWQSASGTAPDRMKPFTIVLVHPPEPPLERVTIGGVSRVGPVGMPALLVDGTFIVESNIAVRGSAVVSLISTFPNARLLYTLDGSEPDFASVLYSGPFVLPGSVTLRAVAYNADLTRSVQAGPLTIQVLPRLTASTLGGGTVTVDPPAGAYSGAGFARVTANSAPGWTFLQWLGDVTGPEPVASVSMNRARCVQAVFGTSVSDGVVGGGSVVRNPVSALYPYGETVRLTGVPLAGSYFAFWANAAIGTNNPLSFSVTNAQPTVAAVFAPLPAGSYALAVISQGFGSVDLHPRGNRFAAGTSIELTATPEEGQAFLGWAGHGGGTNNPLVVSMTQSRTIVARFTDRPRLTIVNCDGSVDPDELRVLVTGDYGASYTIEAGVTPGAPAWVQRGILETPFGSAQYVEPIAHDLVQRIYRAIGE